MASLTPRQRRRVGEFAALLVDGDAEQREAAVRAALDAYGSVELVAEKLFTPAARMFGACWESDECSFVGVTIALSHMQSLFHAVARDVPTDVWRGYDREALFAPAPGEQHTFGLSVADDTFRRAGWNVDCCGDARDDDVLRLAAANDYDVIGFSISSERLLPALSSTIEKLRLRSRNRSVLLIAGGYLAVEAPQAVIDAGVDHVAATARAAVELSESVLGSRASGMSAALAAE